MVSEKAEEIVEMMWTSMEESNLKKVGIKELNISHDDSVLKELLELNWIKIDREYLLFTEIGEENGIDMVRRHRLAERLLVDVLDVRESLIEETACGFEHVLHRGIDDNICTILGHPKFCPHGKPIPRGKCCEGKLPGLSAVSSLSAIPPGRSGKIAYLQAKDQKKLQKLMAMGVLPGQSIMLLQNFPSFLFKIGNGQFAVDESIADEIYVRLED